MSIPAIPAGAQLGGAGTAENQQAAQALGLQPTQQPTQQPVQVPVQTPVQDEAPPVPVRDPVTGQWVLPTAEQHPAQSPLAPAAQAPVAEAAPVPTQEPVIDTAKTETVEIKLGDSYLESSINHFTTEVGISDEDFSTCIEKALEHNDPSLIDLSVIKTDDPAVLARGKQLAELAMRHTQQVIQNVHNTVHAVAGSKEAWDSMVDTFNTQADTISQEFVAYIANVKKDPKTAAEYVKNFVESKGLVTTIKQAPIQGGTGAPVATGLGLQEYKNGIHQLEVKLNQRVITAAEYDVALADLDYRRSVGRKAGI